MSIEINEQKEIRDYLLGLIHQDETMDKIEDRLMTDDVYFMAVQVEEEELMQDFVDGHLSPDEQEKLETNFLISKERIEKVEFAHSLKRNIENEENNKHRSKSSAESSKNGFFGGLVFRPIPALAIGFLIIAGLVWSLLIFNSGVDPTALEIQFADLNKERFDDLGKYASLSSLNLISGATRGDGQENAISKDELSTRILIRLDLPGEVAAERKFDIALLKDGKAGFSQFGIPVLKTKDNSELRFLLPSAGFEKGDYRIRAKSDSQKHRLYFPFQVK